ncbi:cobyrinate a,c-diamide synthase [Hoeflea sp. CAU 1731]
MAGLLIAAPMSGSGKTTFTLGLLRALKRDGVSIAPGKAGPDYIDPAFHAAASGVPCLNYDPWAMRRDLLEAQAGAAVAKGRLLVIEAMMGLFDGAADGSGSAGDLAAILRLPVVFVVDCGRMSHSIAALVDGFAQHRAEVMIGGVILNNVASPRHEAMLRQALEANGMDVFGVIPRDARLELPERHLGLVQAGEHASLEMFIEHAADLVHANCDLKALRAASGSLGASPSETATDRLPPPGQRVAIARDEAFAFTYAHILDGWRRQGAEIVFFSPLADEAPDEAADAIYFPGGYPELHAGQLAAAGRFREGVRRAATQGRKVYGECGGYMALGDALIDAEGESHAMLGLLPLVTSFAERRLHLGYRRIKPLSDFFEASMTAHEFHYATLVSEAEDGRLFETTDALGEELGRCGLRRGGVAGSFMHVIDIAETP